MLSFFRRAPKVTLKPFDFTKNRFPSRSSWPPQFDDLSGKEKFKLERKFRRRMKLKWARPSWNKGLILFQWASITCVIGYAALYMDWGGSQSQTQENLPEVIKTIRQWYFGVADGIWSKNSSMTSRAHVEMMQDRLLHEREQPKSRPS